jgi:uncharacterized protein YjdB/beta-N-acetylglucosaminidase
MLVVGFTLLSNVGNKYAFASTVQSTPSVSYSAQVQNIGWQGSVADGAMAGTEGQALRMEAIKISVNNVQDLGVQYSAHVQNIGWQSPVSDGAIAGTVGQSLRMEAIKIQLTGAQAQNYDIYYRAQVQTNGWMNWAKNGEVAGTTGESKRIEAMEMVIVPKGSAAPVNTSTSDVVWPTPSVTYTTHVQDYGWLAPVSDGALSGKDTEGKRIEAVQISLKNSRYSGGISYKTQVQDYGWLNNVSDGAISGTTGQAKRAETIQVNLTGDIANYYDVYYRVESQDFGWLDWAKDGQSAGTVGLSKAMEGLEIVLVPKGGAAPGATDKPFYTNPSVTYSSQVQDIGWQNPVADGALSGTVGQAKRLEAIKIGLQNSPYTGDITYSSYVQDTGWGSTVSDGDMSGTVGQSKRMEQIKIGLTGDIANYYDVYYRVQVQTFGWLDWAKDGQAAGTDGLSTRIEAIQIVLVAKGGAAPGATNLPLITKPSVDYSSQVQDIGWQDPVADGADSGTIGKSLRLEAVKINLQNSPYSGGITYQSHVQDYGWMGSVSNGTISGTVGQSKRMEAINIQLTGDIANYFDVYYRVNVELYGWLGWAKDGMDAGSTGLSKRIETIEIKLVPKGQGDPVDEGQAFIQQKQPIYTTTNYNYTLNHAVDVQMALPTPPQTNIYDEYVSANALTEDVNGNWTVNGSSSSLQNVYSGPSTSDSIVGTIKGGTAVSVQQIISAAGQPTWYKISDWINALQSDVVHDMNPLNFSKGSDGYFQFLKLSEPAGLNADEVNQNILYGKGILQGTASSFIQAGNQYGINEIYLISHALLETGNGTSPLAVGVHVNVTNGIVSVIDKSQWKSTDTVVYNMYGIGAVDGNALQGGAQSAYNNGWFTPDEAIIGGAQFIAANYIDKGQDTLYKMRWNPAAPGTHQYATDDQWAINQVSDIKSLYDLISSYVLVFDQPQYQS